MSIWFVGEAMLELSRTTGTDDWRMACAGDTLNTAIHLARQGHDVGYLTALGNDSFSATMRSAWAAEGLRLEGVLTHPTRQPGLYAIDTDASGERSFTYWRDQSAVRELFLLPAVEEALQRAGSASLLAFSLITLGVLPPVGRQRLLRLCSQVRAAGGRVAFDGNYRARLWPAGGAEAAAARDAAIAHADIGLPTLEDEQAIAGARERPPTPDEVANHWRGLGCSEVVVKLGAAGCLLGSGETVAPARELQPVDTSGAGDAFNAGYLGARLAGDSPAVAALAGHALAGWVVMQRGALPARTPDAPYSR